MADSLSFSRSIYRLDAIEAAVGAYAELAEISVEAGESEVVVTFTSPHPAVADELTDAFGNHVLFETVRRHREAIGGSL